MKDRARLAVLIASLGSSILLPVLLTIYLKIIQMLSAQPPPLTHLNGKAAMVIRLLHPHQSARDLDILNFGVSFSR